MLSNGYNTLNCYYIGLLLSCYIWDDLSSR